MSRAESGVPRQADRPVINVLEPVLKFCRSGGRGARALAAGLWPFAAGELMHANGYGKVPDGVAHPVTLFRLWPIKGPDRRLDTRRDSVAA